MWQAMTPAEREAAPSVASGWLTGPTPLTSQALEGLDRAEKVAAAAR